MMSTPSCSLVLQRRRGPARATHRRASAPNPWSHVRPLLVASGSCATRALRLPPAPSSTPRGAVIRRLWLSALSCAHAADTPYQGPRLASLGAHSQRGSLDRLYAVQCGACRCGISWFTYHAPRPITTSGWLHSPRCTACLRTCEAVSGCESISNCVCAIDSNRTETSRGARARSRSTESCCAEGAITIMPRPCIRTAGKERQRYERVSIYARSGVSCLPLPISSPPVYPPSSFAPPLPLSLLRSASLRSNTHPPRPAEELQVSLDQGLAHRVVVHALGLLALCNLLPHEADLHRAHPLGAHGGVLFFAALCGRGPAWVGRWAWGRVGVSRCMAVTAKATGRHGVPRHGTGTHA